MLHVAMLEGINRVARIDRGSNLLREFDVAICRHDW